MMDFMAFLSANLWQIIMGGLGIVVTVVTIRANMNVFIEKLDGLHIRVNGHSDRIRDLEVAQAERLGFERGQREARESK